MGGEREGFVASGNPESGTETSGSVGGSSGQRIRFHESAGQVHFHDDTNKLKAALAVSEWWKAWERLRVEPTRWEWFDTINNTILVVETQDADGGVEAYVSILPGTFGKNFKSLNAFTKKR